MWPWGYSNHAFTGALVGAGEFRSAPLRVLDGGARDGTASKWDAYGGQAEIIAFEPDADECGRLNESGSRPGLPRVTYYPVGLWRERAVRSLRVASAPESSSLLPTNHSLVDRFSVADRFRETQQVPIRLTDIDSFLAETRVEYVDFIKLDVEGAELMALEGSREMLRRSVHGVFVEIWFHRDHIGRPLFPDIDAFLRAFGYVLFDMRDLIRWRRKTQRGTEVRHQVNGGQLMFANALYLRDVPGARLAGTYRPGSGSRLEILKLASLAEVFGYNDFALEVLQCGRDVGVLRRDEIERFTRLLTPAPSVVLRFATKARNGLRRALPESVRKPLRRKLKSIFESS
jgi:FkbM family methyltransferase